MSEKTLYWILMILETTEIKNKIDVRVGRMSIWPGPWTALLKERLIMKNTKVVNGWNFLVHSDIQIQC